MMNLCEFAEDYSGAPLTEDEFASAAAEVEDCPELAKAGLAYVQARMVFLSTLAKFDIEMG
jgi:hypothetical protein